jgi:hypothetical protein
MVSNFRTPGVSTKGFIPVSLLKNDSYNTTYFLLLVSRGFFVCCLLVGGTRQILFKESRISKQLYMTLCLLP